MSKTKLILLSFALLIFSITSRVVGDVMPDDRLTAVSDFVLVGGGAQNPHEFAKRNGYEVGAYSGALWRFDSQSFFNISPEITEQLISTPACADGSCQFFAAKLEGTPSWLRGLMHRQYLYLWAETGGKTVALIEDHDLW